MYTPEVFAGGVTGGVTTGGCAMPVFNSSAAILVISTVTVESKTRFVTVCAPALREQIMSSVISSCFIYFMVIVLNRQLSIYRLLISLFELPRLKPLRGHN